MARRSDEAQAEALEVVERVVEGVDLQLAAVARAGIDLADGEGATQPAARCRIHVRGQRRQRLRVGRRRRLGDRRQDEGLQQQLVHRIGL
jgi:hypothetical protein